MISKLFGAKYDKKVVRRRGSKADLWDEAAEIEDEETEAKQWKFKSDGAIVPAPDSSKIGYIFYRKWWHKLLFMPRQRKEFIEFREKGDGQGNWCEFEEGSIKASDDEHVFQTHQNLMSKKYIEIFSQEDKTELWLAAYLTVLVVINLAGMYIITQGVESGVASAVANGLEAGVSAGSGASETVPGVGILAVAGRGKIREWKEKVLG